MLALMLSSNNHIHPYRRPSLNPNKGGERRNGSPIMKYHGYRESLSEKTDQGTHILGED
jgi:hypothetical protein